LNHSRFPQIAHQQVALGVDVGRDMMGDLSCVVAQANPTVERDRTEPDRSAVGSFFKNQPQTDVVPLVGAPAIQLLESELLLFALIIERADRRIVVWPRRKMRG
jgi:hypothetical protein